MKRPPEVTIERWTHPRLPPSHPLSERWSIMFEGKARMTFSTAADAINAARIHGWTVVKTLTVEALEPAAAGSGARAAREG